jgi:hypothetical protein
MHTTSRSIATAVALLFITGGVVQTLTVVSERCKSDVLESIAAKGKVFAQRQQMPVLGKTPARARGGLRSAAKNVLPRAAKYCPTKIIRCRKRAASKAAPPAVLIFFQRI